MLSYYNSSSVSVLVADDHELTRLSLKLALAGQKNIHLVGLASNGKEAVKMVESHRPDVIILDLHMPIMDGWSASSYIKNINPQTKIIAYSAMEEKQAIALQQKSNFDAFCSKETDTKELIKLVKELAKKADSATSDSALRMEISS
ncbi:two-component system response regulator [[Phormidium ambiguum] IAM M-71]|uniref:Two-component system response regulator n=1 Tax=[Phormidium ambiguum] IAM M-71 TaxID=454136 RepID=A0A1U7IU24_9CYAN|nr:response regulator transcription factor [Phormidium ambiguum]OKH41020.1 two-component system response regulator [Phormidium ambiguum IAM M-71]